MSRPLRIGISACFFHSDPKRPIFKGKTLMYFEQSMAHWLLSEKVFPYMIPAVAENSPVSHRDMVAEFDGLLLQGGSDVSPCSYGEEPMRPEWSGDAIRDRYEIELVREFEASGKPILGICRGLQLINVAFGGSLYQDIQTQLPTARDHRNWEIYDYNLHTVRFEKGSRLESLYPSVSVGKVNSIHHQAIKDLGKGLVVEAVSESDGIVEAVRKKEGSSVFAVQWHPEFQDPMRRQDSTLLDCKPILREFLKEVRQNANR